MNINKILKIVLLTVILGIALIPRSVEVFNKNYLFGFDQGRDYMAVKSIVADHKFTLIGSEVGAGSAGLMGIFQGPMYYYFLAASSLFSNGDPYSGLVLMWIISVSSVVFSYFLGKKIFGEIGGLTTALLFALSPMFIAQARFTWNSNPSTLFILLTYFFVYLSMGKKNKYIFLSSFFAAFVYNFEFAVSIPLSVSVIVFYIFIARLGEIKKYLVLFSGFTVGFLPMLLFEIRHGFMGTAGFVTYLFSPKEGGGVGLLPSQKVIADHLSSFFNAFNDVFPKNIIPSSILLLIVLIPAIYYFFREKNKNLKKFIGFLFLLFPIHFLVFFYFRNAIWVYYLIALNVVYILLFSYSLASTFVKINIFPKIIYLGFILFIIIRAIPVIWGVSIYDYKDYGGTAKIKGETDAINFVYNDAKGKKFGLFIFSPAIYTYPFDYVLWWYTKDKFGYTPDNSKTGLFYLLIERDKDKPWRDKGWQETVIKEGTVVWEKTLPSGFIVQKRVN